MLVRFNHHSVHGDQPEEAQQPCVLHHADTSRARLRRGHDMRVLRAHSSPWLTWKSVGQERCSALQPSSLLLGGQKKYNAPQARSRFGHNKTGCLQHKRQFSCAIILERFNLCDSQCMPHQIQHPDKEAARRTKIDQQESTTRPENPVGFMHGSLLIRCREIMKNQAAHGNVDRRVGKRQELSARFEQCSLHSRSQEVPASDLQNMRIDINLNRLHCPLLLFGLHKERASSTSDIQQSLIVGQVDHRKHVLLERPPEAKYASSSMEARCEAIES
jgi:hypothetical protein